MWSAITEFCKVFAEKYFIPAILSITGALVVLLFLPDDYWMLVKLGRNWLAVLLCGILFLAIIFVIFICKKIVSAQKKHKSQKYYRSQDERRENENMDALWSSVDSLMPDDRQMIKDFLKNNNSPLVKSAGERYFGNRLLNSEWVVSTEEFGEDQPVVLSERLKGKGIPVDMTQCRTIVKKYKLRDDIFAILKYSQEKYGKISHFE